MNKQKALKTIDAVIKALTGLEKALALNDGRSAGIEIQIIWLELGNLREMVENMKDEDK